MNDRPDRGVSRDGLTRCAHCHTHISVEDSECIGCGRAVDAPSERGGAARHALLGSLRRGFARTRGGLLAASLLGLATLSGCGDDSSKPDGSTADQKVADMAVGDRNVSPDIPIGPAYGIPPQLDAGNSNK